MTPSDAALTLEGLRRRDELLQIAARRGARNLRVFGSVARGEAGPDSDIDFLVDMDAKRSVLDLSELILDLQEALGHPVDVIAVQRPSAAALQLERGAVPL